MAAAKAVAAILVLAASSLTAGAQALSVLPVNVFLSPGQKATSLTITNQGTTETAIQLRAYAWNQKDNDDPLTASDAIVVSPPLVRIAPGTQQVVRLILRETPQGREATYRLLLDQIPPPAEPGVVHMVLRLSIPIFAQPAGRVFPDMQFHLERDGEKIDLVAINAGNLHEKIRDIVLVTSDGRKLKAESGKSPYILSGATRRWPIAAQDSLPLTSETMQLTAQADAGAIDQQVRFVPAH
jgi:fimbrial chaperone protein